MKQTISKKLRQLRKQKGFIQKQVAESLGVSMKRYQAWEEGRGEPPAALLIKIKEFYKLGTVDELIIE